MSAPRIGAALAVLCPFFSQLTPAQSVATVDARQSAPVRRIVLLDHTLPNLDPLRAAIRTRDHRSAVERVSAIEADARHARADFESALEDLGGRVVRHYWIVDGVLAEVPPGALDALRDLPGVRSVWEDATRAPGDAHLVATPILTSTNAANHASDAVNTRGVRGASVTLAVVDSGLDSDMNGVGRPHSTFFPQGNPANQTGGGIGGSRMLANVQVGARPADDPIDHGTRVAGVAIGAKWNASATSDDGHASEAHVVGYSLPDLSNGFTVLSTMVQAWQDCTLDAALYGTKVAVISYDGTFDPLSPEQAAMDACAEIADVFISAMAGNSPTVQFYYQGATNIVTVGATEPNNRWVTTFSAQGPLTSSSLPPRRYPTCIANGDLVTMPSADAEATAVTRSGTSYSAPQVAGAAALLRSVSSASADATRAALAVTLEEALGPNVGYENGVGLGYLRDDRLVDLAQGRLRGAITSGVVDVINPTWTTTVQVNQGEVWAAALAWSRRDVSRLEWANLDLRVSLNGRELGASRSVVDTLEFCTVQATATGTLQIEVSTTSFEVGRISQSFGVAAALSIRPLTVAYGIGCEGRRAATGTLQGVEPFSLQSTFANGASDLLLGGTPHRTMQWIDQPGLSAAFSARGIAFRRDETAGTWPRSWLDMSMTLSLTEATSSTMSTTFTQNYGSRTSQVIGRRLFVLPAFQAPSASPTNFDVTLPFDRPFDRLYDPFSGGTVQSLIVDVNVFATSAGAQPLSYPLDTALGQAGARSLWAPTPGAASGTITNGMASVFGLVTGYSSGTVPALSARTAPALGESFQLDVDGALPATAVVLFFGLSNTTLGGVALPIELSPVGAQGCFALTSMDVSLTGATSATGVAGFTIPVPNHPSLSGQSLYHQAFVADPLANALGFHTTAGLQAVFGR